MDMGLSRSRAVLFVRVVGFLLGVPSALKLEILNNQDWVWGIGLLVSGLFFVLAARRLGPERLRQEVIIPTSDWKVGRWFTGVIRWGIPLQFVALLGWWFWQAATTFDPEGWWRPFDVYSVGTTLLQWGVAIVAFLLLNNWMARRMLGPSA